MREMLEPIFGEFGAIVAQFVTTVAVVLALIAAVYWLVRRFSGFRIGGIGRGRVPRLAIVDAMAVDSRRRLILIRRDNVEHLIMIGGPSDLVVEPSIVRLRQRGAPSARPPQQQPAPTAPSLRSPRPTIDPGPPPTNAPIPFPPQRALYQGPPETTAEPSSYPSPRDVISPLDGFAENDAYRAPDANVPPPATIASARPAVADDDGEAAEGDTFQPFFPAMARQQASQTEVPLRRFPEPFAAGDEPDDPDQPALDLIGAAPRAVANDASAESPAEAAATAAKVSDLEEEMARLLGEITSKRSSS